MNGRANKRTPTRYGVEQSHKASPRYEAASLAEMVRSGLLTAEGARALIRVNEAEAAVLRKILEPRTADTVLVFRRDVLRFFNALVQPIRPARKLKGAIH
jgi:hypothetical protein